MRKLPLALPFLVIYLTACDPVSERQCGVFDHPDLALWQADSGEAQVQYMSEDGTSIEFSRQRAVLNERYLNTDGSSNDEDVLCELTASIRLEATDGSLAFISEYTQMEQALLPSAEEVLLIDHTIEAPIGTELEGDFPADITDSETRAVFDPDRVTYLEPDVTSAEIGGQSYEDVIRINAIGYTPEVESDDADADTEAETEAEAAPEPSTDVESEADPATDDAQDESANPIRQITMAREFGIVAFIDDQDREFVRVP